MRVVIFIDYSEQGGGNYDNQLHSECVPLDMSKTDLQMKCVLH